MRSRIWSWPFLAVRLWTICFLNCNSRIWPSEAELSVLTRSHLYILWFFSLVFSTLSKTGRSCWNFLCSEAKKICGAKTLFRRLFSFQDWKFCWLKVSFKFICFSIFSFFCCCYYYLSWWKSFLFSRCLIKRRMLLQTLQFDLISLTWVKIYQMFLCLSPSWLVMIRCLWSLDKLCWMIKS